MLYAWDCLLFNQKMSYFLRLINNNSYFLLFWTIKNMLFIFLLFLFVVNLRASSWNLYRFKLSLQLFITHFIRFWNLFQLNRDYLLFFLSYAICRSFISFDINALIIALLLVSWITLIFWLMVYNISTNSEEL